MLGTCLQGALSSHSHTALEGQGTFLLCGMALRWNWETLATWKDTLPSSATTEAFTDWGFQKKVLFSDGVIHSFIHSLRVSDFSMCGPEVVGTP